MNKSALGLLFFIIPLTLWVMTSSCKKNIEVDSTGELTYSTDTVFFDTVFTTIGSVTKTFKIYNPNNGVVKIDNMRLRGGSASHFRIAADGDNGIAFSDVEILPGDSLFLFAEVTVDPNDDFFPFIVEDFVDIQYNGKNESIYLAAFGQNAHFHGGPDALTTIGCNEVWNNDLPHVVYGVLEVEPGCQLTINPGTQVYMHKGAGILINEGELHVQGELGNEVVFQGDRLDADYTDLPGQWGTEIDFQITSNQGPDIYTLSRGGIWIYQSTGSTIDYAILKNGNTGIQVDTTGTNNFALTITNTKIDNMAGVGLWGQGAHIKGRNLLITNCAEGCAYFSIGGKYEMDNCTFANYWSGSTRTAPTVALNNYYKDVNQVIQVRPIYNTIFTNCIMYGNSADLNDFNELVVDLEYPELQDYMFRYCLIDYDGATSDVAHWDNNINQQVPDFCDANDGNFKVNQNSTRMMGGPFGGGLTDILQQETGSWKGCYDYTGSCD